MARRTIEECDGCHNVMTGHEALTMRQYAGEFGQGRGRLSIHTGEFCAPCVRKLDAAVSAAFRSVERAGR